MRPVSRAQLIQSATRKGFEQGKASDHLRFYFYVDGRRTRWQVYISHGASELLTHELALNARAMQLRGDDLYKILSCEHDAAKTRELFETVYPAEAAHPPGVESDEEIRSLKSRLEELTEAMKEVGSDDEALPLVEEYEQISRRLQAIVRK